ncbi:hypothetical protein Glove_8g19 [Diversispora epigaea]|uniref:Uncharacterized protein n=1 Tax=Diversispora epigaea TaxID=1348612 RepID=A0A397JQ73_9GLOM|nr:hypothetical protein Glove_8g19 [Diversispora epigaea]
MQSEVNSLRQRISELEVEKAKLEVKNVELLKQVMKESSRREAENIELRTRIEELEKNKIDTTSSDISSNICARSSEPKSLEDIETDNFLDAQSKKEVSD